MAVAKTKPKPVTIGREEAPERMPERMSTRDPNVITNRAGEVIDLGRVLTQNDDRLDLKKLGIFAPDGWTYEWRTWTVKGQEWVEARVQDAQTGWTPVPASRHDGKIMPKGYDGPMISGACILMERPAQITALARQRDNKQAIDQLKISHSMAGLMGRVAPNSGAILDNSVLEAQRGTFFRKVAEPENSGYVTQRNYTIDE